MSGERDVYRVRAFVDFWNFQLSWNNHTGKEPCDWSLLPEIFLEECASVLKLDKPLVMEEMRLYASYNPENKVELKLKNWLENTVSNFKYYHIFLKERRQRIRNIKCTNCGSTISYCPYCHKPLAYAKEKGVDSLIIIDMMSLAWSGAYDIGILVTNDSDFIPAVKRVEERSIRIVNATWKDQGTSLAENCSGAFYIEPLSDRLNRRCAAQHGQKNSTSKPDLKLGRLSSSDPEQD